MSCALRLEKAGSYILPAPGRACAPPSANMFHQFRSLATVQEVEDPGNTSVHAWFRERKLFCNLPVAQSLADETMDRA